MSKIKLRTKAKDGATEIKAIITHPMHNGRIKDKDSGEVIPAKFIQEVVVTANDAPLLTCNWSGSISKNPYISIKYPGKSGDKVKLAWTDNTGAKGEAETAVK